MNDLPQHRLVELLSIHGPTLCNEPARCAELLREQCPGCDREVDLMVQALDQGTVAGLRAGTISKVDLARSLASRAVVPEQEARWAVDTWAQALNRGAPEPALPEIPLEGKNPLLPEGLPASRHEMAAMGTRAGVQTGFLVGSLLGAIGMMAVIAEGTPEVSWMPLVAGLLGGVLLGGIVGWAAGPAVGPTQKELAGGIAGAVVGLVGGAAYSPLLTWLIAPMDDPDLESLLRAVLGGLLGMVVGAGLGIFHRVFWASHRRRRYDPFSGTWYTVSGVEQELQDEVDTRAGV